MTKEHHAESMRRRYLALVAAKRCVSCGRRDEDTLSGFARCAQCREIRKKRKIYNGQRAAPPPPGKDKQ